MKLSIIVLTRDRIEALGDCLTRLHCNTVTAVGEAEIIVVDNGSHDGTAQWLAEAAVAPTPIPVTVVRRPTNEGVCARNYGIDLAAGDFIAQVDDDVLVTPGWDDILLDPMRIDPAVGATGQEGFYQEQSWSRKPWSAGLLDDRRRPQPGQHCDFVMGYCWAWRNELNVVRHADNLHTFDSREPVRFRYDWQFSPFWHEESDLQLQIRAAGYRILCVPSVANHKSLHPWELTKAGVGPTAARYADEHFEILKTKWQADRRIRYEGAAVGLK